MRGIATIQGNPNLTEETKAALINNNFESFKAFGSFWQKATGGTADISDLLAFGVVAAPQAASGPASPNPGNQPLPGDANADGVVDGVEFDQRNNRD